MAMRCQSRYFDRVIDTSIQCTDKTEHEGMHRNFRPGHKIKWPDYAAEGSGMYLMILTVPPGKDFFDIAEDLEQLAQQYPSYNFMLSEMNTLQISKDRKERIQ